ncbi:hypothetical protein BOX15_Mlig027228g2 [Macrostomum lignano]|uniref:LRAT domain-containing protein n=1 Tax=Macrostomum lignano TaxID=282301 RepID=A0A267DN07_9PLAT|nr:hypothetical protein BOX15_Mlig027228g2 [Macrostomum lignano]
MSRKHCQSCGFKFDESWTAHCSRCDTTFDFNGDVSNALCKSCGQEAFIMQDEVMEICKFCLRALETGEEGRKNEATGTSCASDKPESGQKNDEFTSDNDQDELWRCVGCVCGNQDPHSFKLSTCKWPTKSYYCLDCREPYSAFIWDTELRWDQCPRCNGDKVQVDKIATGGTMIECQNCSSKISKQRFDLLHQEVKDKCENEERMKDGQKQLNETFECQHCGSAQVQFVLSETEGKPCVLQQCGTCNKTKLLLAWDKENDQFETAADDEKDKQSDKKIAAIPEKYKKLSKCCGNFASLHPVEGDPDDDLLVCDQCDQTISLRSFDDRRIPQTVSALRRAVKGRFSRGKMGRPYACVKVSDIDELKPADQLDFRRSLYSHHAIVEKTLPDSKEVQVIEYTGESNRPTIQAFLNQLPTKACIAESTLKLQDIVKCMHRVDYHSLDCFHPKTVLERAKKRVGEKQYHVVGSNCEHFSNWAKANVAFSRQVKKKQKWALKKLGRCVTRITDIGDRLPKDGSSRAAMGVLIEIRKEMLMAIDRKGSASVQDFWCPIRLLIEWSIRRIPLTFVPIMSAKAGCKLFWEADGLLKLVGRTVAKVPQKILAIKDTEDDLDKKEIEREKK